MRKNAECEASLIRQEVGASATGEVTLTSPVAALERA